MTANHALQRTRRERRGCNGFARARSLSPSGLLPAAAFLSPFPKRLKCCVSWKIELRFGCTAQRMLPGR